MLKMLWACELIKCTFSSVVSILDMHMPWPIDKMIQILSIFENTRISMLAILGALMPGPVRGETRD